MTLVTIEVGDAEQLCSGLDRRPEAGVVDAERDDPGLHTDAFATRAAIAFDGTSTCAAFCASAGRPSGEGDLRRLPVRT